MADVKRTIQKDFRGAGLFLNAQALASLSTFVETSGGGRDVIQSILEAVEDRRKELSSATVTQEFLTSVLDRFGTNQTDMSVEPVQIIDAFDTPRFVFDIHRKVFYASPKQTSLHGEASDKMQVYIGRMLLLQQRLRRNALFSAPAFAGLVAGSKGADCELTDLKALHSSMGESRFVMGCISQLEDGCYFLEDLSGALPIDLTDAVTTTGYFIENTIVVADGKLRPDGIFEVQALGMPPPETREESLLALQGLNMFGGDMPKGSDLEMAKEAEKADENRIVFMSDVWLDLDETFDKLATVFEGYNNLEEVPQIFVLMGNFSSAAGDTGDGTGTIPLRGVRKLKEGFASLGRLISKFPRIAEQRWILLPGPGDPAPGVMLPRPPLPDCLVGGLKEFVPTAEFASNPCRLRWYSQELVLFRYDLQQRMRRQCLLDPAGGTGDTDVQFEHLVSTVLQQSHLCPLPMAQQPVYWQHDHTMHLFPLPHVLVLADGGGQSHINFHGCKSVTPGSLCRDGHFASYCLAAEELEMLALPEAMDDEGPRDDEASDGEL